MGRTVTELPARAAGLLRPLAVRVDAHGRPLTHTGSVKRFAAILAVLALGLAGCGSEPIRTYTKAELREQVRQDAEADKQTVLEQYPDAVVPDVDVVRYISGDEWEEVMASCLQAAGWDATLMEGGGLMFGTTTGHDEEQRVAYYVCQWQYPTDPRSSIPLNDRQKRYVYMYNTETLRPCLEAHGWVDIAPVPNLKHFLETYTSGSWDPYGTITGDVPWQEITKACPPEPPGLFGVIK